MHYSFCAKIPHFQENMSKRTKLQTVSIYEPFGFISPVLLIRKLIYRGIYDLKIHKEEI